MSANVAGHAYLFDQGAREMRVGKIAFLSDGESRSEIVIASPDGRKVERLVFARETNWIPVYRLIEAIREMHEDCGLFDALNIAGGAK